MDYKYKCVNCGTNNDELYRQYSTSVLKLSNCVKCKEIVDKYIEYDNVIVIIDLILQSKEAQRHLLFNTDFKTYWKLFVVLLIVESYGMWSKVNKFNGVIGQLCDMSGNDTCSNIDPKSNSSFIAKLWHKSCGIWCKESDIYKESDPFISEKTFYLSFASVLLGTISFIWLSHFSLNLLRYIDMKPQVSIKLLMKGISIGNISILFELPVIIWGVSDGRSRLIHFLLVFGYSAVTFYSIFRVIYEQNHIIVGVIVLLSLMVKFLIIWLSRMIEDDILK